MYARPQAHAVHRASSAGLHTHAVVSSLYVYNDNPNLELKKATLNHLALVCKRARVNP